MAFLDDDGPFTSTLAIDEFALLTRLAAQPLGQVVGASVHQVGWQYLPGAAQWGGDVFCSLDHVSQAWEDARQQAFDAVTAQATALGADAVLGVKLTQGSGDRARRAVDYVVTGTAVRWGIGPSGSAAPCAGTPVLSDLSVDEFWKLREAGWGPAGLVAATAVFFVAQSGRTRLRRRLSTARNQELSEYSRGFAAARSAAIDRLRRQARAVAADGIVGVSLSYTIGHGAVRVSIDPTQRRTGLSEQAIAIGAHLPTEGQDKRDGIMITFQAAGTAIRRERSGTPAPIDLVFRMEDAIA